MSATDDVVLSLPVTARTTARIKHSAGMVSNMLPLRVDGVGAATCADVVAAVTTEITSVLRHQRYRSEDIRAAAGFGDAVGTAFGPLVNLLLFDRPIEIEGARVGYHMLSAGIVEDLVMNVFAAGPDAPLEVGLHANPALYDAAELQTHRKRLLHVLGEFVEDPGRLWPISACCYPGNPEDSRSSATGDRRRGSPKNTCWRRSSGAWRRPRTLPHWCPTTRR